MSYLMSAELDNLASQDAAAAQAAGSSGSGLSSTASDTLGGYDYSQGNTAYFGSTP